ncbi:PAS domain-containing protein [Halorubrum sp. SP3]|nr:MULTISPECIES: PAS domain-containing protein [unclassified Halorubrum]TKX55304.1 PAS domain-containing protein [Halorubrum sp. SP3]TKX68753.1 PAS domain-containing protein [Halorubrum sp. SP9]
MTLRRDVLAAIDADRGSFRTRLSALADERGLDPDLVPARSGDPDDRAEREAMLVDRVRAFDDVPLGLTLTGPAYRDTPIVYVNRWFRDWTGYALDDLRGRNPRLFQAADPDADVRAEFRDARADFREALSTWSRVTVEVRNRRRDGTPFVAHVSLRPLFGDAGTVTHWVAAQEPEPIEGSEARFE